MATAGDGRAPYESDGTTEKFRKRLFRPEINEEPQNVSLEAGQYVAKAYTGSTICNGQTPQHQTTMENLPDEALSNIFIRLLAKQVGQMRSVSKSWNALLSESSFVKSHLRHSIHHNIDQILLVFCSPLICLSPGNFIRSSVKICTALPCQSPHLELNNFIKLPVNLRPNHARFNLIGAVNGLICSSYGDDSFIHIWNPSRSAVSTLPPYSVPSGGPFEINFRFGFDPKTDDYKVIKFSRIPSEEWLQVEVYSMRKGSWKLINERPPSSFMPGIPSSSSFTQGIQDRNGICVDGHDGHLHWLEKSPGSKKILAFDLGSETFREMLFPDSIPDSVLVLGVLAGKLCLISSVWDEDDDDKDVTCEVCVWVMEEYGVTESWVKRHAFSQFVGHAHGFTSHNEFLLVDDEDHLVLYDPIADKAKILEKFASERSHPNRFVEYVDSLVWIQPPQRT